MQPKTKKPRSFATLWQLAFFVTILVSTPCVTVSAQSSAEIARIAYENALLDSALLYQALKPVHHSLERAYEYLNKENEALRNELRFERLQRIIDKQAYEASLANEEKKRKWQRWLGRFEGYLAGLLTPIP